MYRQVCKVPWFLPFEPSLDALSLRSDIISSIQILPIHGGGGVFRWFPDRILRILEVLSREWCGLEKESCATAKTAAACAHQAMSSASFRAVLERTHNSENTPGYVKLERGVCERERERKRERARARERERERERERAKRERETDGAAVRDDLDVFAGRLLPEGQHDRRPDLVTSSQRLRGGIASWPAVKPAAVAGRMGGCFAHHRPQAPLKKFHSGVARGRKLPVCRVHHGG